MKKDTLKNLTHAHAWLGLIISGVLMIVFVCGTLSFYRADIQQWDAHHNIHKTLPGDVTPLSHIINNISALGYDIPADHRVSIINPEEKNPFYQVFFSLEENGEHQWVQLLFDAKTGEKLDIDPEQFYLANMLYRMHINLHLPGFGFELVGIVSLLFFVVLLSGIVIHLKKIISHFYQYRTTKSKDKYLDGHNLIGITALPYTIMYALTGVFFNLSIVFQLTFGVTAFHGNFDKVEEALGFTPQAEIVASGQPLTAQKYDELMLKVQQTYPEHVILSQAIYAMVDKAAVIEFYMQRPMTLHDIDSVQYKASTVETITVMLANDSSGYMTMGALTSLHEGSFANNFVKLIMFILGLGCCYLILTGNLIWIEKRSKQKQQSEKTLRFVKAMTLALSSGTLIAVASGFVATRFIASALPPQDILMPLFHLSWIIALLHGYFATQFRTAMIWQLRLAALMFIASPIYDISIWLLHSSIPEIGSSVFMVNTVLLMVTAFCLALTHHYHKPSTEREEESPLVFSS